MSGPRITSRDVDSSIKGVMYYNFPGTTLTICCIKLVNGFTVTGESACASVSNFNKEIGEGIAFENAKQKIWQLLGYRLVDELYRATDVVC